MFLLHYFLTANEMCLSKFSLNISSMSCVPWDALQAASAEPPKQATRAVLGLLKLFNMEQISKFDHELSEIHYLQGIPWNRLVQGSDTSRNKFVQRFGEIHLRAQQEEHDSSGCFLVERHSCFSYCGVSLLCTGIFHTSFSPPVVYTEHNFRPLWDK